MVLLALALAAAPTAPTREVRLVMGTTAEVWLEGPGDAGPALDAAFAALDEVDQGMSLWKESELTALNRRGEAIVSPALFSVVEEALSVAEASGGAFDPTVEPLVRAMGGLGGSPRPLTDAERASLLKPVGFRHLRLDSGQRRIWLDPGTRLDLGGIAKGFAVDRAVDALRAAGARRGIVDLGRSSLTVFGERLTLEVADPEDLARPSWARFEVRDVAVGSSGGDQKKDHILDPRTGRAAHRVLAATVLAASATEADALSTAVYVLGAEEGLGLLVRRGAAGLVLEKAGALRLIRTTPGFAETYGLRPAPGVAVRRP